MLAFWAENDDQHNRHSVSLPLSAEFSGRERPVHPACPFKPAEILSRPDRGPRSRIGSLCPTGVPPSYDRDDKCQAKFRIGRIVEAQAEKRRC